LIEKYSALLSAPEPSGPEYESKNPTLKISAIMLSNHELFLLSDWVALDNWRRRTPEQKRADFEEIYNEEVRQTEGKEQEDR